MYVFMRTLDKEPCWRHEADHSEGITLTEIRDFKIVIRIQEQIFRLKC